MRNSKFAFGLLLFLAAQNTAKPAGVQGTVANLISGAPVPRAHVTLQGDSDGKQVRYGATSTADGRFTFTGVAPGNYSVSADHVGFVNSQNGGSPRDRVTVMLKADDNKTGVDLKLMPTGALAGRVTDADGEPVEGVSLQAQGARSGNSDVTDENGRYRIGGLAPGKYTVQTSSHGDSSAARRKYALTELRKSIMPRLTIPVSLRGKKRGKLMCAAVRKRQARIYGWCEFRLCE